jgi:hypothetical protein
MPVGDWRPIGALAEQVGAYCWVEHRLFSILGAWAGQPGAAGPLTAEATVFWATASRCHALSAEDWRDRLPVRAGIEHGPLIAAPSGPVARLLDQVAAQIDPAWRLAGLSQVVLPRLLTSYAEHLDSASPVCEGAVMAALAAASGRVVGQIGPGRDLAQRLAVGNPDGAEFVRSLERPFEGSVGLFPGVRPS